MNLLKGFLCLDFYCCYSDNFFKGFFWGKVFLKVVKNVLVLFLYENIFVLVVLLVK